MRNLESRAVFVGPSLGMSILCALPLVALKLFGVVELSWLWVSCPIWIGWAICFLVWVWFSTVSLVCRCIKPVFFPVFVSSSLDETEENGNDGLEKEDNKDGL